MSRTPDITRLQDKILRSGDALHGEDGLTPADILIRGGESPADPINGAMAEYRAGDGLFGVTAGGLALFRGGDGTSGGSGEFRAGDGSGGPGASALFRAGDGFTVGGSAEYRAGDGGSGIGGILSLRSGSGTAGGGLGIVASNGSVTLGGTISISAGDGPAGGGAVGIFAGDGSGGGPITIAAGDGAASGGPVAIDGGDDTGTSGDGGTIALTGGNVTNGAGLGDAGSVILTVGTTAGVGSDGVLVFDYATWPAADGLAGQQLETDGAGNLSWAAGGGGEGLGATLAIGNTSDGTEIIVSGGIAGITFATTSTFFQDVLSTFTISTAHAGGITIDTTPGAGPLNLLSGGSLVLNYATFPAADGGLGTVLTTDGAGALSWGAVAGGDVVGPGPVTDDRIVAFDGASGTLIKEGTVTATAVASHLTDTANPHATDVGNLGSGTLAELNTAITDATLDDSSDPRTPTAHAASHENGGGDEISVAGLSGLLADNQNPTTHAASHENGGGDEISVAGLSGLLADNQNPVPTAGADTTAIHDNVASEISAIAVKGSPVAGDFLVIEDSDAGNIKKHILIGSLPGGGVSDLQGAYAGGNTIVTTGADGDFDVSGSEAISLDASTSSNLTVAGSDGGTLTLTLASTNAGGGDGTVAVTADDDVIVTATSGIVEVRTDGAVDPLEIRTIEITTVDATPSDVTLATIATGGDFVTIEVHVAGQTQGSPFLEYYSRKICTTYFREIAAVVQISPRHLDATATGGGVPWVANVIVSTDDLILRITGAVATTINWSATVNVKTRI